MVFKFVLHFKDLKPEICRQEIIGLVYAKKRRRQTRDPYSKEKPGPLPRDW